MTVAFWSVLAALFIPYVLAGLAKSQRGYDNQAPRAWLARRTGWRQRANWAQQNHFESFPAFAAAVLIAHHAGADQGWTDGLAVLFVLLRIVYSGLYVGNHAGARSLVWSAAFVCVLGLFLLAALA